jgi:hypothetical protein
MKSLSPVNQTLQQQLTMMEHFVHDILDSIETAQADLMQGNRNAAIGALLCSGEHYEALHTLYNAMMLMHRHAPIIEHDSE